MLVAEARAGSSRTANDGRRRESVRRARRSLNVSAPTDARSKIPCVVSSRTPLAVRSLRTTSTGAGTEACGSRETATGTCVCPRQAQSAQGASSDAKRATFVIDAVIAEVLSLH
jgi:hypothetical protein